MKIECLLFRCLKAAASHAWCMEADEGPLVTCAKPDSTTSDDNYKKLLPAAFSGSGSI